MRLKEVREEDLAKNTKANVLEQALATNIAAILEARRKELNKGDSSGSEDSKEESLSSDDGFD